MSITDGIWMVSEQEGTYGVTVGCERITGIEGDRMWIAYNIGKHADALLMASAPGLIKERDAARSRNVDLALRLRRAEAEIERLEKIEAAALRYWGAWGEDDEWEITASRADLIRLLNTPDNPLP